MKSRAKKMVVPSEEAWLYKNKEALALVQKGLEEAKKGKLIKTPILKKVSFINKLKN